MTREYLQIPSPSPPESPTPPRRDSLRHIRLNLKVRKTWLVASLWTALVVISGWVTSSIPYVWSWEKHQVTDEQLGHVLYDSLDPITSKPAPSPSFDEATLPPSGLVTRLLALEESRGKLLAQLAAAKAETAELHALIVDQYRWRVRIQAATSEADPRKRKDSADRAEAKFMRAAEGGKPLDEAYRSALERNPYQ